MAMFALAGMLLVTGCGTAAQSAGAQSSAAQSAAVQSADADETSVTETTGSGAAATASDIVTAASDIDPADQFTERDLAGTYDSKNAETIDLDSCAEGETVTLTEESVYIFSGTLTNGQIVVEAGDTEKVQIVLNGVTMVNDDSACIFVKSADKVFVTLAKGTENHLSDTGSEYVQTDSGSTVDGVIFSREDIVLNGEGSLTIEANYANGIVGKDDLKITGGTYTITAANKGIQANDSIRIYDGTIAIDVSDDAIHTDNDETAGKGYIYIYGGSFSIRAGDDAIHAATALLITEGDIDIQESYEGLEGDTVDVTGGNIDIKASDDGINAAIGLASDSIGQEAMMQMPSGGMTAPTDGTMPTPAEGMTPPTDGTMPTPPEGMTPPTDERTVQGGAFPGGKGRNGGFGGRGGMAFEAEPAACIRITGGTIHVDASGDGIDANGTIYIDGGEVIVEGTTNSGNGPIDFAVGAEINGGTFIASGASGMAEGFTGGSQYSVRYIFGSKVAADTEVTVTDEDGREVLAYTSDKEYSAIIFSTPDLKEGTYTITAGGQTDTVTVSG
ncbi:MAG: carbohydrate-binding domain-containing protein [Lachnospiraceae bacterium]|nr:carbohydrate-binding domain-containing protein [Lachnospiraceae bacterium]